jgi:hypothetical protein
MSDNKKATPSKRSQERQEAEKFLWHMCQSWRKKFSHDAWWKQNPTKPDAEAVVWEMLRRHPRTESLLNKEGLNTFSSELEFFMAFYGNLSWPMLSKKPKRVRSQWTETLRELPPQHGFSPPSLHSLSEVVTVIGGSGDSDVNRIRELGKKFWDSIPTGSYAVKEFKKAQEIWMNSSPKTGCVSGSGVNWEAFKCISSGGVLIGFDPKYPNVEKIVQKKVSEIASAERRKIGVLDTAGRSFWQDWLQVIQDFEQAELSRGNKQIPGGVGENPAAGEPRASVCEIGSGCHQQIRSDKPAENPLE